MGRPDTSGSKRLERAVESLCQAGWWWQGFYKKIGEDIGRNSEMSTVSVGLHVLSGPKYKMSEIRSENDRGIKL